MKPNVVCYVMWLLITTSRAVPLGSKTVDIEKTVEIVEKSLKSNPNLPKLTRKDILDLFNDVQNLSFNSSSKDDEIIISEMGKLDKKNFNASNITDNLKKTTPRSSIKHTVTERNREKLMVVLPYTNADGGLQELVTRPPRVTVLKSPRPMETNISKKPLPSQKQRQKEKRINILENTFEKNFLSELNEFFDKQGLEGTKNHSFIKKFKSFPTQKSVKSLFPKEVLLIHGLEKLDVDSVMDPILNNEDHNPQYDLESLESNLELSVLSLKDSAQSSNPAQTEPFDNISLKFQPINYETTKVLPLNIGPNPAELDTVQKLQILSKRQNNESNSEGGIGSIFSASDRNNISSSSDKDESAPVSESSSPSLEDLEMSFGGPASVSPNDSELPPPKKNGFYFMLDWNSFLEVGTPDDPKYVNIKFEPKIGDPQMFLPVSVP